MPRRTERSQAETYARQCGLLRDSDDKPCYTVMVSTLLEENGVNCTAPSFVASVDRLASKYLRSCPLLCFRQGGIRAAGQPLRL